MTQTLKSAYGGALKYAKASAAPRRDVRLHRQRGRLDGSHGSNRNQADAYLDGTKLTTVDLYSASGKSRKVVFSTAGLDPSVTLTVEVRVLGTKNAASEGMSVDVEVFIVLR